MISEDIKATNYVIFTESDDWPDPKQPIPLMSCLTATEFCPDEMRLPKLRNINTEKSEKRQRRQP